MKIIIKTLASVLGSGYSPVASGTAGSAVALAAFWLMPAGSWVPVAATLAALIVSVPVCTAAERFYGHTDDGHIVLDELVGMWISLLFLPRSLEMFVAAFLLFRALDVIKPFFIRGVQRWPGGWGIVADDVFAGIFANLILQAVVVLRAIARQG